MSQSLPVFVLAPRGAPGEELLQRVADGLEARMVQGVDDLLEQLPPASEGRPGSVTADGVVVVAPGLGAAEVMTLLTSLAEDPRVWLPLVVEIRDGEPMARPVSLGFAEPLADAARRAVDPEADLPVLELRSVLRRVAKARHDINNPLTAGMAEAQLLLMDVEDPELRESLELIQDQFRRIRDLVADLRSLKYARPD